MRITIKVILLLFIAHLAVACSSGQIGNQEEVVLDQADPIAEPVALTDDADVTTATENTNEGTAMPMKHATETQTAPMKMKTPEKAVPMTEKTRVAVEAAPSYQRYSGGFQEQDNSIYRQHQDDDPSPTDDD